MWFKVDYHSGIPIYEQIKRYIKGAILEGRLKESDPVPSVRELAKALGVNVNTVVRAYRELEMEGILSAQPGVGYFVSGDMDTVRSAILEERFRSLRKILTELKDYGVGMEEVVGILEDIWQGEEGDDG